MTAATAIPLALGAAGLIARATACGGHQALHHHRHKAAAAAQPVSAMTACEAALEQMAAGLGGNGAVTPRMMQADVNAELIEGNLDPSCWTPAISHAELMRLAAQAAS